MKKQSIQDAQPVKAAIMALDRAITAEAERLGVHTKIIVIGIHRGDGSTEIAINGCTCAGCAASVARALLNSMNDDADGHAPDEEFGATADAAGLVN